MGTIKQQLFWVLDGELRIGPCTPEGVEYWVEAIIARGGVPSFELYKEK